MLFRWFRLFILEYYNFDSFWVKNSLFDWMLDKKATPNDNQKWDKTKPQPKGRPTKKQHLTLSKNGITRNHGQKDVRQKATPNDN